MSIRHNTNHLPNVKRRDPSIDRVLKKSKEQALTKLPSKVFSIVLIANLLLGQLPMLAQGLRPKGFSSRRQRDNTIQRNAPPESDPQKPKNKAVVENELGDDHYTVSLNEVKSQSEETEAQATPLPAERTKALLANWSQYQTEVPISKEPIEKNLVTAALDRQPPPAVSPVQTFSSKTSAGRSNVVAPHTEINVLSVSPLDSVSRVQTMRVQFSEQMVALSTIGATTEGPLDIAINPPLKGEWEWLDPKTLQFKGSDDHFPMATSYTVQIGTNLKSVNGTSLNSPFKWEFNTAPIESITVPPLDITKKYYVPLNFDQDVVPKDVFQHISVTNKKHKVHATLVDEAEVRTEFPEIQDTNLFAATRVYLKIQDILPPESVLETSVSKNCPSKEGPALSDVVCTAKCAVGERDRPRKPFAFSPPKNMSGPRPLGQNIAIPFNTEVEVRDIEKYVTVVPPLKNQKIFAQNSEIIVSGLPLDKTTHKIHVSRDLSDAFGRTLPRDIVIPLSFGPVPPILLNSGTDQKEIIPSAKSSSYAIYTVNVPALRVRIFKRTEVQMYPTFALPESASDTDSPDTLRNTNTARQPDGSDTEKESEAQKFPKPDRDFLIYPHAATNQICKSEVPLADLLANGHGHLRLVVQAYTKEAAQHTEKYLTAVSKNKAKLAGGKSPLKDPKEEIEKKREAKKSNAIAPTIPSYHPSRVSRQTNSRLINARIGEQGGRRPRNMINGESGILETSLQFTNLAASTMEGADGKLYCRITELNSGLPVPNAKVCFLRDPYVWKIDHSKKKDGTPLCDNMERDRSRRKFSVCQENKISELLKQEARYRKLKCQKSQCDGRSHVHSS
jgi:hypothetical protein